MAFSYFLISSIIPGNILDIMLRQCYCRNPDFEHLYPEVTTWLVEVENGRVRREVGLTSNNSPIVIAPLGRNDGIWPMVGLDIGPTGNKRIKKGQFNRAWDEAHRRL